MSTTPLSEIRDRLKTSFKAVTAFYMVLGQACQALREHGYTWEQVCERIREWVGETQVIDLNNAYIKRAHVAYMALFSKGALVSPDGKHSVLPEDAPSMALSAGEWDRVASLVQASESITKGPKLRVSQLAALRDTMQSDAKPETKAAAKLDFMNHVAKVEAHLTASKQGDELELAKQALEREEAKLDRMQRAILKQREVVAEAKAKLAALMPPTAEAPKADKAANKKGSRAQRTTSPAQVARPAQG